MKTLPRINATNGKVSGGRLHCLGYLHLNAEYDYQIEAIPNHPELKYLRTYRYLSLDDRYDLSIVDRDLRYLSGPLTCLGQDKSIYEQWFPKLIREALRKRPTACLELRVSGSVTVPLAETVKEMVMGSITNVGTKTAEISIGGSLWMFSLSPGESRSCVLTPDKEVVLIFPAVQVRNGEMKNISPQDAVLYDNGDLLFTKDGHLQIQGYPFPGTYVHVREGCAVDRKGNVLCKGSTDDRHAIMAICDGEIRLTLDRKVVKCGRTAAIEDPVIDITANKAGVFALTAKGELYLWDKKTEVSLMDTGVTAISHSGGDYFVYAKDAELTVLNTCFGGDNIIMENVLPHRGRISDLCVWHGNVGFRCAENYVSRSLYGEEDWHEEP